MLNREALKAVTVPAVKSAMEESLSEFLGQADGLDEQGDNLFTAIAEAVSEALYVTLSNPALVTIVAPNGAPIGVVGVG